MRNCIWWVPYREEGPWHWGTYYKGCWPGRGIREGLAEAQCLSLQTPKVWMGVNRQRHRASALVVGTAYAWPLSKGAGGRELKGRPCKMGLKAQGENWWAEDIVREFCLHLMSHGKPLRISSRKRDVYILKRSFNLLALIVKLVVFMYPLAVMMGIHTRQDIIEGRGGGQLGSQCWNFKEGRLWSFH